MEEVISYARMETLPSEVRNTHQIRFADCLHEKNSLGDLVMK